MTLPRDNKTEKPLPLASGKQQARFCQGDIMRHVIVMAGTGAIGLMAVFAVDLLNFCYISWLGDSQLTAAVAYAGAVGYLQISVSIGMSIGLGAVVGREIGARRLDQAGVIASSFIVVMTAVNLAIGMATVALAQPILKLFGASGEALTQAQGFIDIVSPALPLMALGMGFSGLMRTVGDARRSMQVTLAGAFTAACLDPVLIFGLHEGVQGAAISTVISRLIVAFISYMGVRPHGLLRWPGWRAIPDSARRVGTVAMPAILTNLATPVGGAYVTNAMSQFGPDAVSGQATIDRIVPVTFAFVFALTGSVGPIMSQNLGAGQISRVRETFKVSLKLVALCVAFMWFALAALHPLIISIFASKGIGIDIVWTFCCATVSSYLFVGMLFVANTAFNNLGHPFYSTSFNWGRATLGTIPFVWIGLHYGPVGVLVGQSLGSVVFGTGAIIAAFRVIAKLKPGPIEPGLAIEIPARTAKAAMVELEEID